MPEQYKEPRKSWSNDCNFNNKFAKFPKNRGDKLNHEVEHGEIPKHMLSTCIVHATYKSTYTLDNVNSKRYA